MVHSSPRDHPKSRKAFNSHGIVYDNSPWRPGRDMELSAELPLEEDERKLKNNLATRIMSNGVEVVVKDHKAGVNDNDVKMLSAMANVSPTTVRNRAKLTFGLGEQRKNKKTFSSLHLPSSPELNTSSSNKAFVSSSVATVLNQQYLTAAFPIKQLMQHNYIIKTCLTTYTYLTTVIQNKKSAVSTFETIISVVTTESLTKLFGSDFIGEIRPTKTKYVEMETIQPTAHTDDFPEQSVVMKLEKRIDNMQEDDTDLNYEIIQPSEVNHPGTACSTTSCPCSHIKTENIDTVITKHTNLFNFKNEPTVVPLKRISIKSTKLGATNHDQLISTKKQTIDKITNIGPYKYETTQLPPSEKVVEKYTEVINDYSDEKDTTSVENSELLTNEQAPSENDKVGENKKQVKIKEKPLKHNKNKFAVADLLKLGSLGIKGLSQLAPVIEKMTGDFIKRHDTNKSITTTTLNPVTKITPYAVNKRVDSSEVVKQIEKHSSFPIYIPVDELETSESQHIYTNATLHQNLAWAAEHKHPKAHYGFSSLVHESPLLNGGIPISPGEIITANSDVIVGKPAVGGPLTLAASGIKLQSSLKQSSYDNQVSSNEPFLMNKRPSRPEKHQSSIIPKHDDSFDLKPPELPQLRTRQPPKDVPRRPGSSKPYNEYPGTNKHHLENNQYSSHRFTPKEQSVVSQTKQSSNAFLEHGSPALLDYIPELNNNKPNEYNVSNQVKHEVSYKIHAGLENDGIISDSNPSSSENIHTRVQNDGEYSVSSQLFSESMRKPFLVNIQPSRVANVLIPHGSSTALIFAGSSEPHKTGDYIDDPLPYPEPGYFGSFSIDAPQMTMVHNVAPSNVHENYHPSPRKPPQAEFQKTISQSNTVPSRFSNDFMNKWNKHKRPNVNYNKIPPPTSNQETHIQVGPHIASYNPEQINPSTHDFDKYNNLKEGGPLSHDGKHIIDKEYENHLAVPPPPPPKSHYNNDNNQNSDMFMNGRPYNQRPIFHTKPIQDMKVFLNIQHPVSKPMSNNHHTVDSVPPKVTSEIYFAAAAPQDDEKAPTYTVHLPVTPTENPFNKDKNSREPNVPSHGTRSEYLNFNSGPQHTSSFRPYILDNRNKVTAKLPVLTPAVNKPTKFNVNDNIYSVTVQAATNVGHSDKILGSSIAVPLATSYTNTSGIDGAGIPIGTNVAMKVDGNPVSFQSFNMNSQREPPFVYSEKGELPEIILGDNRWNYSLEENNEYITSTVNYKGNNENSNKPSNGRPQNVNFQVVSNEYFHNSHANFPMIYDSTTKSSFQNLGMKPVTEDIEDKVGIEQKLPSKLIPKIPTNSHGWHLSNPIKQMNINTYGKINGIQVDSTTRNIIPLSHSHASDSIPEFGDKIPSIGVPPTGLWNKHHESSAQVKDKKSNINSYSNGNVQRPPLTTPSFNPAYIPSNFGISKQPTYPIPLRDDDDYNINSKNFTSAKVKPVYENSEEIYDGGSDESINDGEVSLESMKIPVISTMDEKTITPSFTFSKLPNDEVIGSTEDYEEAKNRVTASFHNTGSQTEKPFSGDKYNQGQLTPSQFSTQHPFYISNSHMRPRPFKVNINTSSFSNSPSPHWQINHILENLTTAEPEKDQNLVLNIGEEIIGLNTNKAMNITTKLNEDQYGSEEILKTKPSRPIFSLKYEQTQSKNESTNIITSTINLSNQNPLTVINITQEENTPSSSVSLTHLDHNHSMMDIVNLSPPPPTMDYNFKPSSSDETIMGMSPPPARIPIIPRVPSVKTPPPLRTSQSRPTLPPRTPPSYMNKPVRTLPPKTQPPRTFTARTPQREQPKNDVSTYRPPYDTLKTRPKYPYNRDRSPPTFVPEPSIKPPQDLSDYQKPNVIFPTLISSGWLTSSTIEFPSKPLPEFSSSSVQFSPTSSSYENPTLSEIGITPVYEQTPVLIPDEQKIIPIKFGNTIHEVTDKEVPTTTSKTSYLVPDSVTDESNKSQEELEITSTIKVIPLNNRNRTQYMVPEDFKHASKSRIKLPIKPTAVIRPTKTIAYTETLQPTRIVPSRKKVNNIDGSSSRIPTVYRPTIIESSESSIEDEIYRITPTETLKEITSSSDSERVIPLIERTVLKPSVTKIISDILPTHHAGNEIKISEEIIPTKTEFKTTAITLTKTLLEPPKTVSTTRFLNLTHTLTVTHTKTSLVSQSAGATTQTLVLTNTQTSTIVDVVTEIHTQVQPTTIVETVTKHIPIVQPTSVFEKTMKTEIPALDDISISSEEDNLIISPGNDTIENIQKLDKDEDSDTFLIVMNKSQNGGTSQPVNTEIESSDYDGVTRNEEVNNNGVSQVLFGGIVLAGTPYLETTNVGKPTGSGYSKECQPDCKASRNEGCQRIDGMMKCVCRPGFARMFPDRPCKPTYTYSVKLALSRQGKERLQYHDSLANNASKEYHSLASATHEGINRMVMQSDLRDVFHGIHINGFHPVDVPTPNGDQYTGVANDFYVQLSDNAHETRLKEVIEKYLRNNNYSLGGTDVIASGDLLDQLHVSDFDECHSVQFHDCSEHAQCFNLRGTYTCSCQEGFADMSVNSLYPGRICSAEQVGCERCNYHGACYTRDDNRVLCECFQWYSGSTCNVNLKVILISLTTVGAALIVVLAVCGVLACSRRRPRARAHPIVASCIQSIPSLHQGGVPSSKQRAHDRRALINERTDTGDAASVQNLSLPYMPTKKVSAASSKGSKKFSIPNPPTEKAPVPGPCVMIPRARLHQTARDGREGCVGGGGGGVSRKPSVETSSEAKLISYLESGSNCNDEMMRRKHSEESSYSLSKERYSKHNAAGALVSAGFKVSTTVKPDESVGVDDASSITKADLLDQHYELRQAYSQDDISEWTDAERRIGELTLSEARSVGGTLPASTGRAASSARLTHQEANTMAERDLGSTFLLPHVHLYKPELGSDVSEFDSL